MNCFAGKKFYSYKLLTSSIAWPKIVAPSKFQIKFSKKTTTPSYTLLTEFAVLQKILPLHPSLLIILEKKFFPIKRKQGVNNCFKPLILPVFTTVASRLKLKQQEKEKYILKLNTTFSIQ